MRAVVDMEYVASEELGDLFRLGIVLEVHFTYAVRSVQHITILLLKHVQHTLDDVRNSWAWVVCGDGRPGAKLADSCQQVVGFIAREFFIEPLNLEVFVIVVRTGLDARLRKFDVL